MTTTNQTENGEGKEKQPGHKEGHGQRKPIKSHAGLATCAACLNWNGGVNPDAAGIITNMPGGGPFISASIITDDGLPTESQTPMGFMPQPNVQFDVPLAPVPAQLPVTAGVYLFHRFNGQLLRKLALPLTIFA